MVILTQALIDKLAAWQRAGQGLLVYLGDEIEGVRDLSLLRSGMQAEVKVYVQDSPIVEITEANWCKDYETLICERDVQKCRERLQKAKERLAQRKRAALAS